jgi:hypothetical protein
MRFRSGWKVLKFTAVILMMAAMVVTPAALSSCREYDKKLDIPYYFKTDPEKAVLDFIYAMSNHDSGYIYDKLILDRDKKSLSKEKFLRELAEIMSDIESIQVERTVYLGYENEMSKVVVEFEVRYSNGDSSRYKKYIYLQEENSRWKIVFDKTFI